MANWPIQINPDEPIYVPFTLKKTNRLSIHVQETKIPLSSRIKYLSIILNKRLI